MIDVQLLKCFPFFKEFTDDELELVIPYMEARQFTEKETILYEKTPNPDMYFLAVGSVDIFVQEKFVANLGTLGEVLGEMALGNQHISTATVKAKLDSMFFVLSIEELIDSIAKDKKDRVMMKFYKSATEMLTKKLMKTNAISETFK